jgi:hypothetical protein
VIGVGVDLAELYGVEDWTVFWTVVGVLGAVALVVMVFFLLNLRNLLNQVAPHNRSMQPNSVWLNLIPLFGLVWMVVTVSKVRDSVRAEFRSRDLLAQGDFGYGVGLAFAIMSFFAGVLVVIPQLVCFVIYWMKTAELKRQLVFSTGSAGRVGSTAAMLAAPPASRASSFGEGAAGPASQPPEAATQPEPPETTDSEFICPVCGAANRANAKFCRSCGRSF